VLPKEAPKAPSRIVGAGLTGRAPSFTTPISLGNMTIVWVAVGVIALVLLAPYLLPASDTSVAAGVTLQGEPMAGMTRVMLNERVGKRYERFLKQPVTLVYQDRVWQPSASELGISLDIRQTNNALLGLSTTGDIQSQLTTWWARWTGVLDVAPQFVVNGPKLQRYLMNLSAEIDQPALAADLLIDNQTGQAEALPAQTGRQLLVDESMIDIYKAVAATDVTTVTLRTRSLAVSDNSSALTKTADTAERFLSAPLVLQYGGREWVWERDRLSTMIITTKTADSIGVSPDANAIALEVDRLAQYVDSNSVEPRIALVDGVATIIQPGKKGFLLDRTAAVQAIGDAFYAENRTVLLPTIAVEPKLDAAAIAAMSFENIIATGRSSFKGSADYRITNITTGAKRINGVLIAPDAVFSFNTEVGEIDEANGFVQGYAVVGNRTQLEWGGGVCQVSTSMFRAAFYAGLPIVERHAHPYYIRWYDEYAYPETAGPGMDAAIFTGELDFRFRNTTGNWLLIETQVDAKKQILDINLRGVYDGRTVRVVGPKTTGTTPAPKEAKYIDDPTLPAGELKQTDHAKDGMNVSVFRIITQNSQDAPAEEFVSNFRPWPDIYLRGTGPKKTP
jgi:vancomycin resistance protein YoaR